MSSLNDIRESSRNISNISRRDAIGTIGAAVAAAWTIADGSFASAQSIEPIQPEICVFAKPLQFLSFEELSTALAPMGVAGIEATIRRDGQIQLADVDQKLPRLVDALAKNNMSVTIMTTDINQVDQAETEKILTLAAKLGIKYYRMAYYRYDLDKPILPQLDTFADQASKLAAFNRSLGLVGLYQNHAGTNYVGAAVWDLLRLLDSKDFDSLRIAIDTRHTTIENGQSWPVSYRAVKPQIGAVFVKTAIYRDGQWENAPLDQEGNAKKLFDQIKADGFPGPLSLHMEYIDHRKPELTNDSLAAIARDVATLKKWIVA